MFACHIEQSIDSMLITHKIFFSSILFYILLHISLNLGINRGFPMPFRVDLHLSLYGRKDDEENM